jgi:LDH2 family malate/lactate/ureidoglycolate dehydrogenase
MIGLYAAVANANHMAAWGGADLLLGTNPLAIAVPTGGEPLVFDMATSIVAYGTVKKYALRGLRMPEGWFVDAATGAAITDPAKSAAGVLQPMGEYKGSGLALMIGLVAGVLNGAAFGRDVIDFNANDDSATNTGHCIVAVDIARFVPLATFTAEVDRHLPICAARGFSPGSMRSACRASAAPPAATSGPATAFRFRRRFLRNSTNWRRNCR